MNSLVRTDFNFPGQTAIYKGKVRDVYSIGDDLLVMVASDRISAFDHILPKGIPFKGEVLTGIAATFLRATADIVPNWLVATPDPVVSVGVRCNPYPVEMVIRGYLAGHAWREYKAGRRVLCGVTMPEGMKENDRFPQPIITPATKATEGHDLDISREDIIAQGIVAEAEYVQMEDYTRKLFQRGTEMAAAKGLILVDTKYEFGNHNGTVMLIDEIHTPDCSRYWYASDLDERLAAKEAPRMLDKEFLRTWLLAKGFKGDGAAPEIPNEVRAELGRRYLELYEVLVGEPLKVHPGPVLARVEANLRNAL